LGLSAGLDFETRLIARLNAAKWLATELVHWLYQAEPIVLGTNTDPYQRIEKKYEIIRSCLYAHRNTNHPVAIVTRGTLIERDMDIISDMAKKDLARVGISLTALDAQLAGKMKPRAPTPKRRLEIIRRLSEAEIPVRVMASSLIPALRDHDLEDILKEGSCRCV